MAVLGGQPWVASTKLTNTLYAGHQAILVANAVGAWPLTFKWFRDDLVVATSTRRELLLTNTQPSDSGFYTVAVSNRFGVVTGQVARLTFTPKQVILDGFLQPSAQGGGFKLAVGFIAVGPCTLPGRGCTNKLSPHLPRQPYSHLYRSPSPSHPPFPEASVVSRATHPASVPEG